MKNYCIFLLIFTLAQFAFAQGEFEVVTEVASLPKPITVMLFDLDGKGIENAEITFMQPDSVYAKGTTSAAGQIVFENVPTGDYDIVVILDTGKKVMFNNQWIETRDANDL
ncbi:MAG: carboxypeptidase-like regulatory domain-containing protein, partial [Bacteroidia bacterium]